MQVVKRFSQLRFRDTLFICSAEYQAEPESQNKPKYQEKKIEDPLDDLSSGCMVKARYHQSNGGKTFIVNHTIIKQVMSYSQYFLDQHPLNGEV